MICENCNSEGSKKTHLRFKKHVLCNDCLNTTEGVIINGDVVIAPEVKKTACDYTGLQSSMGFEVRENSVETGDLRMIRKAVDKYLKNIVKENRKRWNGLVLLEDKQNGTDKTCKSDQK